jgi:hypothetical protein
LPADAISGTFVDLLLHGLGAEEDA